MANSYPEINGYLLFCYSYRDREDLQYGNPKHWTEMLIKAVELLIVGRNIVNIRR